jgi:hypothetical protein
MGRFINIFHKNVDQHFLKMLQHFSGKKINFFSLLPPSALLPRPLPPPSPPAGGSGGQQREPGRDVAELAGRRCRCFRPATY